jgi:ArsR family transcriptional regulator
MDKPHVELSDAVLRMIAARFRMLSEPMRLKILHALEEGGELSVSELVEATQSGQANVSKHLGLLLDTGIVSRRKEGLNSFYRIADQSIFDLCQVVCSGIEKRLSVQQQAVQRFTDREEKKTVSEDR